MSNAVTEARVDLVEDLQNIEGLNVYDAWPNKIALPAAVVVPDDPYVTLGKTMGTYKINLRVLLITKHSANSAVVSEALDGIIDNALNALTPEWGVGDVELPSAFTIDGVNYLGTSFTTTSIYERSST